MFYQPSDVTTQIHIGEQHYATIAGLGFIVEGLDSLPNGLHCLTCCLHFPYNCPKCQF